MTSDLDHHVRKIVALHLDPKKGTPFWIRRAVELGIRAADIDGFDGLSAFGGFDKEAMKRAPHADFVPGHLRGKPFHVFETGGTTGLPTQRLSWQDHLIDYSDFSATLSDTSFPRGGAWLIAGPTGPRRLRLAMEHLANVRGGPAYHLDLDPRWVRRLLAEGDTETAQRYADHVVDQMVSLLQNRPISCMFTTPKLLEAVGERLDLADIGVKGVLCGGTSMTRQAVRFWVEEVLDRRVNFVPVYGNTLMGLAASRPVLENDYAVIYHPPLPRAVIRVVDDNNELVAYGERGRVELTTLTEELFLPRLLERDEAIRRPPTARFAGDGVEDVRPLGGSTSKTIEGVY